MKIKCECPEESIVPPERMYMYSDEEKSGMNHKPNKCRGTNRLRAYKRAGKIIYLCSCCCMFGDIELDSQTKQDEGGEA